MTAHVDAVLEVLTAESNDDENERQLAEALGDLPPPDLAETLAALAERVDEYGLGYVVFPAVRDRLRDEKCYRAVAEAVRDAGAAERFQVIALDVLDGVARERDADGAEHAETLRAVAGSTAHATAARATAARLLARHRDSETVEILGTLVADEEPALVDAVGHVVAVWAKHDRRVPDDLAGGVVAAAGRLDGDATECPRLLAALGRLADHGLDDAADALATVADGVAEPAGRARLIRAAGFALDDDRLADVAAAAAESGTGDEVWALRAFRAAHPERADDLLRADRSDAVAAGIATRPVLDPDVARRLADGIEAGRLGDRVGDVLAGGGAPVAESAANASTQSTHVPASINGLFGDGLPWFLGGRYVGDRRRVRDGYASGLGLADALYRDLALTTADVWWLPPAEHWHSALFLGFDVSSDRTARMERVEAGTPVTNTVYHSSVDAGLGDAGTNLVDQVRDLREAFVDDFQGGDSSLTFHGAYTTGAGSGWVVEPIGGSARERIANTASTLLGNGIRYTFADQLDYNYWNWDGTPGDIDEIRCDGIIEYSYERNGIKVCEGKDASEWDVSRPGVRFPENHNDFHTFGWNHGEICPAVQGGGHGNDTRLKSASLDPPEIETFDVELGFQIPLFGIRPRHPPRLSIRVDTLYSETAFVRIAVRPVGGEFHFVRGGGWFGNAVWDYREVATYDTHEFEWRGGTDGPNFRGDDGEYEFRVVAVDRGGNVSHEYARTVKVYWP